ncbi:hypothetical protein KI809_15720 [Geobacter pelophilus]|uniref:Peptidase n=1 Tax=Geoanaerobacter pelophilus TaxID=60036 RepID=A0AAW4L4D8_9BACT|nr:hypothetical protein [Geoanaerobacter pelophilus]MBT0665758.1 hypothetical protein [Geoanaerobacter pelophilus]
MGSWIEGFKPGKHIDTAGIAHTFTETDCRELAEGYSPDLHEAPIVAGHPKHDDPAMGWVGAVRFNEQTKRVEYTEDDVAPEFAEMLSRKLFKKRSLALYSRDDPRNPTPGKLYLRHVGYLGAMPPAIKGLKDRPAFKEAEGAGCITFEFGDWNDRLIARLFRSLKNFLTGEFGQEKADKVLDEWDLQSLTEEAVRPETDESLLQSSYHEQKESDMTKEEVQAVVKESLAGVTQQLQQFAETLKPIGEQIKTLSEQNTALARQFAEGEDAQTRREFTAFCESLPTRIIPGEIPTLVDQMMNLRKAPAVQFGEGEQKKDISAVEDFQLKLKSRAETIQFGEFAGKGRAGGGNFNAGSGEFSDVAVDEDRLALHNEVLAYQEAHSGTSYETALTAVMNKKGGN